MEKSVSAKSILKFAALIAILAGLYFLSLSFDFSLDRLKAQITRFSLLWSFFVFAILYAFVSIAPIPGRDIFKLLAAVAWGWWFSTLFVFCGEMLAALVGFGLARLLGKDLIDRLFGEKIEPYYEKLNRAGFQAVFIFRVLPITPYRLFNFAAGVTNLKWGPYLAGSGAGIFLRTLFFQFIFTFFGNQLVQRGITVRQLAILSILASVVMLVIWCLYNKIKSKKKN